MAASRAVMAATTGARATCSTGLDMRCCRAFVLVAAWLALAPPAFAQEVRFDPLRLSFSGFLAGDGSIDATAPAPGAIPFAPATPPAQATPLRFTLASPVTFTPGAALEVTLQVRADAPVVARDADGFAFEVNVEPGGAAARVAIDPPLLTPGSVATLRAQVVSSALYREGSELALTVRPLMSFTEGALSLVVGGKAPSTFAAPDMRVPTPAELRLQDVAHTEFLLEGESFEPPATHAVNVFRVSHTSVTPPAQGAFSRNGTYVVLRGEEPPADAASHASADRDARVAAAHELRVNGVLARVHPGLGVVVRAFAAPVRVECVRNCPADLSWSFAPPTSTTPTDAPSSLIAPPRDTSGIPVSEDEPDEKPTPLGPGLALLAVAGASLAVSKRR